MEFPAGPEKIPHNTNGIMKRTVQVQSLRRSLRPSLLTPVVFFFSVGTAWGQVTPRYLAPSVPTDTQAISELSRRGLHYEALKAQVQQVETTPGLGETLALAQSAWALGLVETAREHWDSAFARRDFLGVERARAMLGRAIMELQEKEYEAARSFAEQGAEALAAPSELRAQFWLVVAEALKEQGALSLAEGYYVRAFKEGDGAVKNEAAYLLGECRLKLGRVNEARYSFTGLDAGSQYTPQALRRLAEIDHLQRNYEGVLTWIEEGRESFPSEFQDGWVSYVLVSALLELKRRDEAHKEVNRLKAHESEQDVWSLLATAALEADSAKAIHAELAAHETDTKSSGIR